jgi:hypothetical protein
MLVEVPDTHFHLGGKREVEEVTKGRECGIDDGWRYTMILDFGCDVSFSARLSTNGRTHRRRTQRSCRRPESL